MSYHPAPLHIPCKRPKTLRIASTFSLTSPLSVVTNRCKMGHRYLLIALLLPLGLRYTVLDLSTNFFFCKLLVPCLPTAVILQQWSNRSLLAFTLSERRKNTLIRDTVYSMIILYSFWPQTTHTYNGYYHSPYDPITSARLDDVTSSDKECTQPRGICLFSFVSSTITLSRSSPSLHSPPFPHSLARCLSFCPCDTTWPESVAAETREGERAWECERAAEKRERSGRSERAQTAKSSHSEGEDQGSGRKPEELYSRGLFVLRAFSRCLTAREYVKWREQRTLAIKERGNYYYQDESVCKKRQSELEDSPSKTTFSPFLRPSRYNEQWRDFVEEDVEENIYFVMHISDVEWAKNVEIQWWKWQEKEEFFECALSQDSSLSLAENDHVSGKNTRCLRALLGRGENLLSLNALLPAKKQRMPFPRPPHSALCFGGTPLRLWGAD